MISIDSKQINGSLISYFSNMVKQHGGINLAQGIPGFSPPEELLDYLSKALKTDCHQYAPGTGNSELREQILLNYPNISSNTELFITNGATEAISLIYTYLESKLKKDLNVLSFSPAYESYIHLPKIFGNNFTSISTRNDNFYDRIELENTIAKNKIKLIFLASPGNPYGKIMSKQEMQDLIDICNSKKIYLIIDAVYSDIYFDDTKPSYPIENISEYIFYVNSFSKKLSITGWRIGYFLAHASHLKKIAYIHDYIGLSTPAPLQQAVADYLKFGTPQIYINNLKDIIKQNLYASISKLEKNDFYCPNIDGGYFIWAKLPEKCNNSLKFGLDLYKETRTAIIPGKHFGEEWDRYIRINIAREEKELSKGIDNIIEFVKRNR